RAAIIALILSSSINRCKSLARCSSSPANWWYDKLTVSPNTTSNPHDCNSLTASSIGLGSFLAGQVMATLSPFFRNGGCLSELRCDIILTLLSLAANHIKLFRSAKYLIFAAICQISIILNATHLLLRCPTL